MQILSWVQCLLVRAYADAEYLSREGPEKPGRSHE